MTLSLVFCAVFGAYALAIPWGNSVLRLLEAILREGKPYKPRNQSASTKKRSVNIFSITENAPGYTCVAVKKIGARCQNVPKNRDWAWHEFKTLSTLRHDDTLFSSTIEKCVVANLCGIHSPTWGADTIEDWTHQLKKAYSECWRHDLECARLLHELPNATCSGVECTVCLAQAQRNSLLVPGAFGDESWEWTAPRSYTDNFNTQSSIVRAYFGTAPDEGSEAPSSPPLSDWQAFPERSKTGLERPFSEDLLRKVSNHLTNKEKFPGIFTLSPILDWRDTSKSGLPPGLFQTGSNNGERVVQSHFR